MIRQTCLTLLLMLAAPAAAQTVAPAPYKELAPIAIPDGRWDLASHDLVRGRVLIARSDTVTVVDLAAGNARSVGAIAHGHAALPIPGGDLIAVTSGKDNSVRLLAATDGHELARIAVGNGPDAALWAGSARRLVVMNAEGGTVSLIDPAARRVTRTIRLKPGLELAAEIGGGVVAINNEDASEIELIDLARAKPLPPIAVPGCTGPTGIAYDQAEHLLLSACANGVAALVDTHSRRLVRLLPIGSGPDTALYDPHRHRFAVPCGKSGTLSVFAVAPDRSVRELATITTEVGARSGAIDVASGRIYLPAARFAAPVAPGKRGEAIAGSAHLIVLEPVD